MRSLSLTLWCSKARLAMVSGGLLLGSLTGFAAEEPVLNLYSARHYATDEALYDNFTRATGIKSTGSMRMTPASWPVSRPKAQRRPQT